MKKIFGILLTLLFIFNSYSVEAVKNKPDNVVIKPNKFKPHELPKPPQIKRDKKILPPTYTPPSKRKLGDPPPPPYPNKKLPPAPQPNQGRHFVPPQLRK